MTTTNDVASLAERVLAASKADETEVTIRRTDSSLTRFANNEIHQNVAQRDASVTVRAGVGRRYGIATTNDLSDDGIAYIAQKALAIAEAVPEQAEYVALPEPRSLPQVSTYAVNTAEFGPMQRAAGAGIICRKAQERGLTAAGAYRIDVGVLTIANSRGLLAHHTTTTADLTTVIMSDSSSGHAGQLAIQVDEIDPEALADEAVRKAELSRDPRSLTPGEFDVVLEEFAVSDILDFLGYAGFGAQAVQEGRSFMSEKRGSRIMGTNVSIWDDPTHPTSVPRPFDAEGMPAQRVDLVVGGVAGSPVYDRRTAAKEGVETTGHALPASYPIGPMPRNLFLLPGDTPRADLVRTMKRGLLVTRFWYTRVVHPLTVHMTGMTRDGTFLVEDGEIVAPVENMRFTESYVEAMNRVEAISRETKLVREFFSTNRVPALRIKGWRFTGQAAPGGNLPGG